MTKRGKLQLAAISEHRQKTHMPFAQARTSKHRLGQMTRAQHLLRASMSLKEKGGDIRALAFGYADRPRVRLLK